MVLNISVGAMAAANPSAPNITVVVRNATLRSGAVLLLDSTGYSVPRPAAGPAVFVTVEALRGSNGALAIVGAFSWS